jgi:hypothetical protein
MDISEVRQGGCVYGGVRYRTTGANLGWGTPWTGSALVLRRG